MAAVAVSGDSFTEQRRAQKRPGTNIALADDLRECIASQLSVIAEDSSPIAKTLSNGISGFLKSAFSPEDFQKLMACAASVWKTKDAKEALQPKTVVSIATKWLIPWLCRCDLRFIHKGLVNLLRADIVMTVPGTKTAVVDAFQQHLTTEIERLLKEFSSASVSTPTADQQPLYMRVANFIDAVSVSASPIFPQVFEALFPRSLLLCSTILETCVLTAIQNSIDIPTVHSDNLEEVRFVVRVVATHVHKNISTIPDRIEKDGDAAAKVFGGPLASLLFASTAMLSTAAFPKDVLNAAGLLVATALSSSHHKVTLNLLKALAIEKEDGEKQGTSASSATDAIRVAAVNIIQSLLANHAAEEAPSFAIALFSRLVPNGRFAFYKGLLSHFSSPMYGGSNTLLMAPCLSSEGTYTSILHNVIFPIARRYCDEQREPDTRFMAIQTLDHMIKYLASTLEEILGGKKSSANAASEISLPSWFVNSAIVEQTTSTVLSIIAIITSLWDDPTQQVSGPLYATYGTILDVSDYLQKIEKMNSTDNAALPSSSSSSSSIVDPLSAFQAALRVRADRRGKYHTMLALLPRLEDNQLLEALKVSYASSSSSAADAIAIFSAFVESLIITANNPKICSVSGDLFASLAGRFLAKEKKEGSSDFWNACIIQTLTRVLTSETLTTGLSVTDSLARGNIVTHMVTPILKQGEMGGRMLKDLLKYWAMLSSSSPSASVAGSSNAHLIQATVDLLYRARSSGVSLSSSDIDAGVWSIVKQAADGYDTTLRLAALNLLLLSTKAAEKVTPDQLAIAARLVRLYSQNGGDSTTRNDTLGVWRLWLKRLVDSLNAAATPTNKGRAESAAKKKKGGDADNDKAVAVEVTAEGPEVLSEYISNVFAHLVEAVNCITEYLTVGKSSTAYASERRYFCFVALETLWALAGAFFTDTDSKLASHPTVVALREQKSATNTAAVDGIVAALYPINLRAGLKATLYEGWDMLRECGARLLGSLCEKLGASNVFVDVKEEFALALSDLSSGTHRAAQGGARIVVSLLTYEWETVKACEDSIRAMLLKNCNGSDATVAASSSLLSFASPSAFAASVINMYCSALAKECVMVDVMTNANLIRASPLHGRMILVGALYGAVVVSSHSLSSDVIALGQSILATCTVVASYCSGLVSGSDKVDCRGHVFSEGDAAKESENRVIVNNSWLGVRSSCAAAEKILSSPAAATSIGSDSILSYCNALVTTLLLTKHNGVMGKARATLRYICRLLLKTRCDQLRGIPTLLINDLLGASGVGSSDEGRILRRSQGLPHAILPILEAEDASLPLVLFPKTMKLLVDLIGAAQSSSSASSLAIAHSINALNVLKFIFDNSIFSGRITPWSQEAFIKAAEGFNSGNWAVRNSSLMLFSSVIHRIVGDHPSKGGGGVTTSLHDLQLRIPNGLSFAIDALKSAVDRTAEGFAVDPALFPLLLLFSMLCPDAPHVVHDQSSQHIVSQLITVLQRCGALRNVMVRAASGSALVAIVPVADLDGIVRTLMNTSATVIGEKAASSSSLTKLVDQNTLHGNIQHLQKIFAHYVGTLRIDVKNSLGAHSNETTRAQVLKAITAYVKGGDAAAASTTLLDAVRCMPVAASYLALAADVMAALVEESAADVEAILSTAVAVVRNVLAIVEESAVKGHGHSADIGAFSEAFGLMLITAAHKMLKNSSSLPVKAMSEFMAFLSTAAANSFTASFASLTTEKVIANLTRNHRAATVQRFSGKAYLVRNVFASAVEGGISPLIINQMQKLLSVPIVPFALNVLAKKVGSSASPSSATNARPSSIHPQICEDSFTVLSILARGGDASVVGEGNTESSSPLPPSAAMCALISETEENSGMRGALLELCAVAMARDTKVDTLKLLNAVEVSSRSDQPTICRKSAVFALTVLETAIAPSASDFVARMAVITALWIRLLHDDEEEVRRCTVMGIRRASSLSAAQSRGYSYGSGIPLSQPSSVEYLLGRFEALSSASTGKSSSDDAATTVQMIRNILEEETADDDGDNAAESDAVVDADDEEDEDLFDEEQDNMYWEPLVIKRLTEKIIAAAVRH